MNNKLVIFILSLIFFLGLFLRTYDLGKVPISLTIDEVAIGYNAYSILKTGKDEHGIFMPLAFKSIGDFKAPLLIYATVPAIYLFGLTEFGIRITTALFGSLTILVAYLLISKITNNKFISLVSAFSLAISPWHIKFSRSSFEAILALFLVIFGVYLFLKAVNQKGKWLWLSSIVLSLSMYGYHAERIFTPLLVILLSTIYRKELVSARKQTIVAFIFGVIASIPLFITLLNPLARIRAEVTFLTRDVEINSELHKDSESRDAASYIFDNNFLIASNFWAKRYLEYFDLDFIFIDGMKYSLPLTPDIGLLYLAELPLTLLGFLLLFKDSTLDKKLRNLILGWLLIGILAASFANNAQHPLRALTWIPILQLFSALGLYCLVKFFKNFKVKMIITFSYISIMGISLIYFVVLYGVVYQYLYSEGAMDGWKEAAIYAFVNRDKYKEIVIDPRFGTLGPTTVGTPYTYVLFFGKIDPHKFQTDPRRKEFETSTNFKNFTFRELRWDASENSDKDQKDSLYIGSKWVLPAADEEIHKRIYLKNGKEILRIATPK